MNTVRNRPKPSEFVFSDASELSVRIVRNRPNCPNLLPSLQPSIDRTRPNLAGSASGCSPLKGEHPNSDDSVGRQTGQNGN